MKRISILLIILFAFSISAAWAQTTIPIDSRATYLRTSEDLLAVNAAPISLETLGIKPGDTITVRVIGDMSYCWPDCPEDSVWLVGGVFSSSSVLLPPSKLNRVPGAQAIRQGSFPPCESWTTLMGDLPTDIPGDFGFWSFESATVKVPPGAQWLFIAVVDSFYGDNADPNGNLAVEIQKALVATPLNILWRVLPWETNRMTTSGPEERDAYPNEGAVFYAAGNETEPGTTALYRYNNGPDHRDSTLTDLGGGYLQEGPLAFPWTSHALPGLSPMVEGFNPETGDYALMQPGEKLAGYNTEPLNAFGYKRYYNQGISLLSLTKGGVTVESNRVLGGSLWRWTWNGTQFLNQGWAALGAQSRLFFDLGEGPRGMDEGIAPFNHGSPLVLAENVGSVQRTRAVPLEDNPTPYGGGPDTPVLWRDVVIGKDLALNFNGMGSVAKYTTYLSMPRGLSTGNLLLPIVITRSEFNRFWVYYADTDLLLDVTSSMPDACIFPENPYAISPDFGGIIVSDASGARAFGIYGASESKGGSITVFQLRRQYCWGDGPSERAADNNRMDAWRVGPIPAGESTYNTYMVTDSVEGVRQKMHQLYLMGAK
jgi:hypothetical protein